MEWIILFTVSWIMLIILVNIKKIKVNIWNGIAAAVLQYMVDANAINHEFYRVENAIVEFQGSSVFFILGPVFVVGLLMAQFHPTKRILTVINVIILAMLYSMQELFLLKRGVLIYTNWAYTDSIVVNISAMIILSWFCMVVLKKARGVSLLS